jgi:hypothetical protein
MRRLVAVALLLGMLTACGGAAAPAEATLTPVPPEGVIDITPDVPTEAPGNVEVATSTVQEPAIPPTQAAGDPVLVEVYSAVIRQLYTVDHTFEQPPNWPRIYVLRATDDTIAGDGSQVKASIVLSADVQAGVEQALSDLPTELVWIDSWDEVEIGGETGLVDGGEGAILTLGNLHPQADSTLQVPVGMTCGGLCGTGMTYVLEEVDGSWQVTDIVGPVWIS